MRSLEYDSNPLVAVGGNVKGVTLPATLTNCNYFNYFPQKKTEKEQENWEKIQLMEKSRQSGTQRNILEQENI